MNLFLIAFLLFLSRRADGDEAEDEDENLSSERLVYVGETIQLFCIADLHDRPTDSICLKKELGIEKPIELNLSKNNDSKTASVEFMFHDVDIGEWLCHCKAGNTTLSTTILYVERALQNVTSFSGVYFYQEFILFQWELGRNYFFDIKANITWLPSSPPTENNHKTCDESNVTHCIIYYKNYYGQSPIFVSITLISSFEDKRWKKDLSNPTFDSPVTYIAKFDVNRNTKSDPPHNFHVTSKNSTCFTMFWTDSKYLNACTLCTKFYAVHKILKSTSNGSLKEHMYKTALGQPYNQSFVTECGLKPFTSYILQLQIKGFESEPWSSPATTEITTDEFRPLTGPPLLTTSFYEEACESNMRTVYLYWNEPSQDSLQGILTEYILSGIDDKLIHLRWGSNYISTKLKCNVSYNISIMTSTKIGVSIHPSVINIPVYDELLTTSAVGELLVQEMFKTDISLTLMNLSIIWTAKNSENITLFFYMCEESYLPFTCFDDMTVAESELSAGRLILNNISIKKTLLGFALLHKNGKKKGVSWINCVYRKDSKLTKPEGLAVTAGRHNLLVSWISTPCSRTTKVLILQYTISVCRALTVQPDTCARVYNVSSAIDTFAVDNLLSNEEYYVYIQAVSPFSRGPASEPKKVKTLRDSYDDNVYVLGLLLSCTIIIIGACFLLACLYRKCYKRRIHFDQFKEEFLFKKSGVFDLNCHCQVEHHNCFKSQLEGHFTCHPCDTQRTFNTIVKNVFYTNILLQESLPNKEPIPSNIENSCSLNSSSEVPAIIENSCSLNSSSEVPAIIENSCSLNSSSDVPAIIENSCSLNNSPEVPAIIENSCSLNNSPEVPAIIENSCSLNNSPEVPAIIENSCSLNNSPEVPAIIENSCSLNNSPEVPAIIENSCSLNNSPEVPAIIENSCSLNNSQKVSTELASNILLDSSYEENVGQKNNTAALVDYVMYAETQTRHLIQSTKKNSSSNTFNQTFLPARFYSNLHDDGKLNTCPENCCTNLSFENINKRNPKAMTHFSECGNNISDPHQNVSEYVSQYVSDCGMKISNPKIYVFECRNNPET
ncbi:uncharacterized protein LOC131949336 isoform X2 [Physella acuta]|nr:uncharacterized protein LOC131949336 isoform X2 [Physella acuta]